MIITIAVLILIALITGISFFISVKDEEVEEKKFVRRYAIISILVFWLLGIFALVQIENIPAAYLTFQIGFFLMGMLHVWLLYVIHRWNEEGRYFQKEFLYTVFITALGAAGFIAIFFLLKPLAYKLGILRRLIPGELETSTVFNATPFLFILPFLFRQTYLLWFDIPEKIYKRLIYYPNNTNHHAYDARHIRDKMLVNFSISLTETGHHNMRQIHATVDENYHFGGFFHVFIAEYNRKNPRTPIIHLEQDGNQELLSWLFYVKPRFWLQRKRYIDPYATFRANNIRTGDIVVALRIPGTPLDEQLENLDPAPDISPPSSKITIRRKS